MKVVIGVDLGTGGVRALAVDKTGQVQAYSGQSLTPARSITCVDSTSGSLVVIDEEGDPLRPAIMYNDSRSQAVVQVVRRAGQELEERLGYKFSSSFALPKIVWFSREEPDLYNKTKRFLSATDFIVGRLSGVNGVSDYSNALKTGFDLVREEWPAFIENELGIPLSRLPDVRAPGSQISSVSSQGTKASGIPEGTPVIAGATDGTASVVASGAVNPGDWNATLGSTLVLKGISEELIRDPRGRIYCHRHPDGWWMPGGASNTGAEWVLADHPGEDPEELSAQAEAHIPTPLLRYPLIRNGERFPFSNHEAKGFVIEEPISNAQLFGAGLEGVAYTERLAFETLEDIGARVGDVIYATGGASRSDLWLEIRASVLNKILLRPKASETAMGAALLAAKGVWFSNLKEAADSMVVIEKEIHPNPDWVEPYKVQYGRFLKELIQRGYI